jgi:hypothetical protein
LRLTTLESKSGSVTAWKFEKLVTCPLTLLAPKVALTTLSHWFCAFVLNSAGVTPAGTVAGSNGIVTVTGTANVVPCGVNANICPIGVRPGGSGGALADDWSTAIAVTTASAPGGISTFEPLGPSTVPPAEPMPEGAGCEPAAPL